VSGAANVRSERDSAVAEGAHGPRRILSRQQIGAGDVGALSRQSQGDGAPDAAS
jgi:hypothetical protein